MDPASGRALNLLAAGIAGAGIACVAAVDPPTSAPAGAASPEAAAEGGSTIAAGGPGAAEPDEEEIRDGRWLYERSCSGCHGPNGEGDGETARQLGVQARSFALGAFAFGNTREQIFRTLSTGIPGRSVMPSFAGILSEEERWLVVDHVRTLMPREPEEEQEASVLRVGSRAVVARGKLPPLADGLPERPRGLLLGLPEGMTFEYDAEDVRLLAVRLGGFADREDWHGRGGGHLRPLGQVAFRLGSDPRRAAFASLSEGTEVPLLARLTSTWIRGPGAGLDYRLEDDGAAVALVRETCCFVGTSSGPGFVRRLAIASAAGPLRLAARVAGDGESPFQDSPVPVDPTRWWELAPRDDGSCVCVLVSGGPGIGRLDPGSMAGATLELSPGGELELEVAVLERGIPSRAELGDLAREIGP